MLYQFGAEEMPMTVPNAHATPRHNPRHPTAVEDHGHGHAHDHGHAHVHDHGHGHGHPHGHSPHAHSHAPGERHPPARLSPSLLRASLGVRLAVAVPLVALLWALTLWVVGGAAA